MDEHPESAVQARGQPRKRNQAQQSLYKLQAASEMDLLSSQTKIICLIKAFFPPSQPFSQSALLCREETEMIKRAQWLPGAKQRGKAQYALTVGANPYEFGLEIADLLKNSIDQCDTVAWEPRMVGDQRADQTSNVIWMPLCRGNYRTFTQEPQIQSSLIQTNPFMQTQEGYGVFSLALLSTTL